MIKLHRVGREVLDARKGLCPKGHRLRGWNLVKGLDGRIRCRLCRNEKAKLAQRVARGTKPGATGGGAREGAGRKPKAYVAAREEDWVPVRAVRTECKNGHPFTDENTAWIVSRGVVARRCRECRNRYHRQLQRGQG